MIVDPHAPTPLTRRARARRMALVLSLGLALCLAAAFGLHAAAASKPDAAARPTRADLDGEERRAARLESEVALAATRRPYLVLDLEERMLRYRLMGMTMREVPIPTLRFEGLVPSTGGATTSPALAGILSLKEKEGDPRLKPLSPEQVEDGADDENAANVLPPEVPKEYRLTFNQRLAVRVAAEEEKKGVSKVGAWFQTAAARLRGHGPDDEALVRIRLGLEPAIATEVYRSLLPDQRWLVIPPLGYRLPEVGQEPPPKPKAARPQPAAPARPPKKPDADRGVPFAFPAPIEPPGPNGSDGAPGPGTGPDADPGTPPPPPPPPPAQRLPDGGT